MCMEIHNKLGGGLTEAIYKDALELELKLNNIPYEREKPFRIYYKGVLLAHSYYADFIVDGNIVIEIKAISEIIKEHFSQTLNYMKLAESKLGIIINFGGNRLQHKRMIL
ncbi:GxxExxY protein [Flavobacterium agri]|uniref:GxxExxY protein n=1 Tax=Flavobacterium agri TaxID=2743471 RepID=UPI00211BBB12|nr:GxxExxY protein [Flavobacterium agri]